MANNNLEYFPPYGVVKVEKDGKWGIMQYSTQRMLTDYIYTELEYLMHGCARFKKNNIYGIVYYDGTEIFSDEAPIEKDFFKTLIDNKYNTDKYETFRLPHWVNESLVGFKDYLRINEIPDNDNKILTGKSVFPEFKKHGLIDNTGRTIIPPIYDNLFLEGTCIIGYNFYRNNNDLTSSECSFYNYKGELLFEPTTLPYYDKYFDDIFVFYLYSNNEVFENYIVDSDGVFFILLDENEKPLNTKGIKVDEQCLLKYKRIPIPRSYVFPEVQSNGTVVCRRRFSTKDYGLIDMAGNLLLPFVFSSIKLLSSSDVLYQVSNGYFSDIIKKTDHSNSKYQKLIEHRFPWEEYRSVEPLYNSSKLLKVIRDDGKCGIINRFGGKILPYDYKSIYIYNDKYLVATLPNDLCGVFATYSFSKNIVPCNYKKIEFLEKKNVHLIITYDMKNKRGVYDSSGEMLIPCEYDEVRIDIPDYIVLIINNSKEEYWNSWKDIYRLYDREKKTILPYTFNGIIFNKYYYANKVIENSWGPRGVKKQVALAARIGKQWQLKDVDFNDIGEQLYDDVLFKRNCVLGYISKAQTLFCDYWGKIYDVGGPSIFQDCCYEQEHNSSDDSYDERDLGDFTWSDLGKSEEDYIINNGGDWILDS